MRQKILFSYETPFSGEHNIYGYTYGAGSYSEPLQAQNSAAIVGAMRGNEHQQLYICSRLSKSLAITVRLMQAISSGCRMIPI